MVSSSLFVLVADLPLDAEAILLTFNNSSGSISSATKCWTSSDGAFCTNWTGITSSKWFGLGWPVDLGLAIIGCDVQGPKLRRKF